MVLTFNKNVSERLAAEIMLCHSTGTMVLKEASY